MKSTDTRTLRSLSRPCRFSIPDSKGLYLWVRADLKKYWIFRFTYEGKRHDTSFGSFPEITLSEAKNKAIKFRGKLLNGVNPLFLKKIQREEQKPKVTFGQYALDYINRMSPQWSSNKHSNQWESTIRTYAFPVIEKLPIDKVNTEHILQILEPIWANKSETAKRLMGRIERIISASITSGFRTSANPAIWKGHLENLLPQIRRSHTHHEALAFKEVPDFMAHLSKSETITSLALQFVILNASRTSEIIYAKHSEVSGDVFTIPPERMKARKAHQLPLCSKSLELIGRAKVLDPGSDFLFSINKKPLSNMTMLMLVKRYRSGLTVHGFRSSFRDWVSEETNHSPEVAEMALAHTIGNRVADFPLRSVSRTNGNN